MNRIAMSAVVPGKMPVQTYVHQGMNGQASMNVLFLNLLSSLQGQAKEIRNMPAIDAGLLKQLEESIQDLLIPADASLHSMVDLDGEMGLSNDAGEGTWSLDLSAWMPVLGQLEQIISLLLKQYPDKNTIPQELGEGLSRLQTAIKELPQISEQSIHSHSLQTEWLKSLKSVTEGLLAAPIPLTDAELGSFQEVVKKFQRLIDQHLGEIDPIVSGEVKPPVLGRAIYLESTFQRLMDDVKTFTQQSTIPDHKSQNEETAQSSSENGTIKIGLHQLLGRPLHTSVNHMQATNGGATEKFIQSDTFNKEFNRFFIRQVQMTRFPNGISEARIKLLPEALGSIDVKLSIQNGVLQAQFIAETQAGKELLESNLSSLRNQLIAHGIQVEKLEISMQPQPPQNHQGDPLERQGEQRRGNQSGSRKFDSEEDEAGLHFDEVMSTFTQQI
jgi:flagellar hook-length control protein FliK